MIQGGTSELAGNIIRGKVVSAKEYTNFAHTIDELGFSVEHSKNHVQYNLAEIFQIPGFHKLAEEILALKLKEAGWNEESNFINELISNNVHEVFALSAAKFSNWLMTGELKVSIDPVLDEEAIFFFSDESDDKTPSSINFKAGHTPKKVGHVNYLRTSKEITAELLHNKIQTALFAKLCNEFGADFVGTEIPTGVGTAIDVMVRSKDHDWLYEIKTASSVKTCIRQALPQLLEYAYWGLNEREIKKLIIVSPHKITPDAENYLVKLRAKFNLPLYYEQYLSE